MPSVLNAKLCLTRPSAGLLDDPMNVGFVAWRVAFYVAGNAAARDKFLQIVADFLTWRLTHLRGRENGFPDNLELNVYPQLHVNVASALDNFEFPSTNLMEPRLVMPMLLFDASPPYGKKVVAARIEFPTAHSISILWSGALYNYRERFEAAGVALSVIESDDQRDYFRVINEQTLPAQAQFITELFGNRVLHAAACLCTLVNTPAPLSAAACMLNTLRTLPYLEWRAHL